MEDPLRKPIAHTDEYITKIHLSNQLKIYPREHSSRSDNQKWRAKQLDDGSWYFCKLVYGNLAHCSTYIFSIPNRVLSLI